MMIYLMRHAEAVSTGDWGEGDGSRPLSDFGETLLKGALPHIAKSKLKVNGIFSSPFKRTQQTAEIISSLFPGVEVKDAAALSAGARADAYKSVVLKNKNLEPLLLVGHMPDLNIFAARLLADPHLIEEAPMEPGEIAALETGPLEEMWGHGKQLWRRTLNEWKDLKDQSS